MIFGFIKNHSRQIVLKLAPTAVGFLVEKYRVSTGSLKLENHFPSALNIIKEGRLQVRVLEAIDIPGSNFAKSLHVIISLKLVDLFTRSRPRMQ